MVTLHNPSNSINLSRHRKYYHHHPCFALFHLFKHRRPVNKGKYSTAYGFRGGKSMNQLRTVSLVSVSTSWPSVLARVMFRTLALSWVFRLFQPKLDESCNQNQWEWETWEMLFNYAHDGSVRLVRSAFFFSLLLSFLYPYRISQIVSAKTTSRDCQANRTMQSTCFNTCRNAVSKPWIEWFRSLNRFQFNGRQ